MDVGVIGVGAIARALVEGLSAGVADPPRVLLSPRGARVSAELAARFANVTVGSSNADVVARTGTVVLAVRPGDVDTALRGLAFSPDQTVVSVVAALRVAELARLVAPATRVVRSVPLLAVARRAGTVPVFPADEVAERLFERVGEVVVAPTEAAFEAYSAVTAVVAAHLDHLAAVSGWLGAQGVPPADAQQFVADMFRDLSVGLGSVDLAEAAGHHATAGGLNEQVRRALDAGGAHDLTRRALDDVLTRVRGGTPQAGDHLGSRVGGGSPAPGD